MKPNFLSKFVRVLFAMSVFVAAGCASSSGQFARFNYDDQVKKDFESFRVNPEYSYYYWGSKTFPEAVVGLSKQYRPDADLWKPVDLTEDQLRDWIQIHAGRIPGDNRRYGSRITGPNAEAIGVWYSLDGWQQLARIEMLGDGFVSLGHPFSNEVISPINHWGVF